MSLATTNETILLFYKLPLNVKSCINTLKMILSKSCAAEENTD